jgi:hypothetical protein
VSSESATALARPRGIGSDGAVPAAAARTRRSLCAADTRVPVAAASRLATAARGLARSAETRSRATDATTPVDGVVGAVIAAARVPDAVGVARDNGGATADPPGEFRNARAAVGCAADATRPAAATTAAPPAGSATPDARAASTDLPLSRAPAATPGAVRSRMIPTIAPATSALARRHRFGLLGFAASHITYWLKSPVQHGMIRCYR